MTDWPECLVKIAKERRIVSYKAVEKQRKAEVLRGEVMKLDLDLSAYDLSGALWYLGPDELTKVLSDESVPVRRRAKVLEIMLLRGASEYSMSEMRNRDAYQEQQYGRFKDVYDIQLEHQQTLRYQAQAVAAVMNGDPALFGHLSRSADQLPSGRVPATEFMNMTLREGGALSTYDDRQKVEKWINDLPPAERGRAMYHLADAASTSGFDDGKRLTGVSGGIGPVELGVQWENAKDAHWQKAGRDIETSVTKQLKLHPEQKAEFYEGFTHADSHLENPRDHYTPPTQ
ncbi:MAG: hypothetical protein ABW221_26460 [Vicinamibacteria bacterium]